VRKYEAIEILKDVLTRSHPYTFIVHCVLGELYNDVEQLSDSVRSYQAALSQLTSLPPSDAVRFYQYLLIVYNMLGLSYVNREDVEQGLGCLAKATQLYQAFKAAPGEDVHHNRSDESRGKPFRFFYEGGNDHDQVEDSYTLT
jgi:tetratricopeptide (TPR) repeat protein